MNKGDLITSVAMLSGLTKRVAEKAINATFQSITATLKKGEEVKCLGWGTFATAQRKATTGSNPRTGEKIQIPAKRVVRLRPGRDLKEAVAIKPKEAAAITSKENVKAVAKDDKTSLAKAKNPKK